tara:strand:- start:478 stop:903 length:426 start_codon:yes stop_codon:yes gene_type:complete
MAITQAVPTSFKQQILNKEHDMNTNTFKIALYTSSATLNSTTTGYATTNEITGTGYVAGGATLTGGTIGTSGTTVYVDFTDPAWTSASFTANGALIYNTSATAGTEAVLVLAFGGDFTVSSGTFTITFPTADASNALIRLA